MSVYPNQPRPRNEWPDQPPMYSPNGGGSWQDSPSGGGPWQDPAWQRPAPRRRRRGRGWIVLLVILAILGVLFVIADRAAKTYAQNMIASKIQSDGFPQKPSVTIQGFPFLTQVAARDIRTIDISANNVQEGKLDISSVQATATGTHINSSFNGVTIDHISGTALITFPSVVSAVGAPQGVTISANPSAGPNAARVSAGPFAATARVVRSGANRISVRIQNVAGISASAVGLQSDYTLNVPKLPAGLQVQGVSVTNQGISVSVSAQNTTLSQ